MHHRGQTKDVLSHQKEVLKVVLGAWAVLVKAASTVHGQPANADCWCHRSLSERERRHKYANECHKCPDRLMRRLSYSRMSRAGRFACHETTDAYHDAMTTRSL